MDTSPSASVYHWTVAGIAALIILKLVVDKVLSVRTTLATIRDCPGRLAIWISPMGATSIALGRAFPKPGMGGYWGAKFSLYQKFGATSLASVLWLEVPAPRAIFWLADSEAISSVCSDRHTFQKNTVDYEVINICGGNLVSTEGSEWKRHRSVVMSAFNEANAALVWSETLRVTEDWFEQLDTVGHSAIVDLLQSMTQVTLFVITAAGFGTRMSWTVDSTVEPPLGCKLTFQSAVTNAVGNIIFRALTPNWFYRLSSLVKVPYLSARAELSQFAFRDLETHMLDLVASARADIASGRRSGPSSGALLWNLVKANMDRDGDSERLTDGEVLSNIFALLLAGHETSSHTLCFVFLLLALHPECQQKLYEEVIRAWPMDVPATQLMGNHKEYMDKLEYTMACIRETLRVLPIEPRLGKEVRADTVLPGTYFARGSKDEPVETGKFSMTVPAGSTVIMDIWAVHMNPLYWGNDADEFKPERFIDTASHQWPRHAFLPFSLGARGCIGRQFAYAEMAGIVASVVRRYRILVPDDVAARPFEEQKEVLLKWKVGVALTPVNPRVKLCRRV